jgi:hypothetical protein
MYCKVLTAYNKLHEVETVCAQLFCYIAHVQCQLTAQHRTTEYKPHVNMVTPPRAVVSAQAQLCVT